ncbi:fumarylacetoacetate hydrolase family protein [Sphingomonas sp. SUN019]|uniref:fumarylacetoacetate hydrolase family protein n=1 Tax=Sphingomonas sp. SUN019 TaxID=2937788 RepID=UPI0021643F10|nr:fumarylacetoacetate hydrolase family protein [Sphingomonas sp. SUN019]UVO51023.1 fumarylacetoacetate hydrolase family protein [Sphingomonas sp. SUN019]
MKLATLDNGTRDGRLVIVSRDHARAVPADGIAATLQDALERWSEVEAPLRALADRLADGEAPGAIDFVAGAALAPLPRTWQWLDGSAYDSHGALLRLISGRDAPPNDGPLMYQGLSHQFYSGTADFPTPSEANNIDFEGEFGIIVDDVPMGVTAGEAAAHIKLIVLINDWSLRGFALRESRIGFGWVQAKPPCSLAPVAITPDELGAHWRDGRVDLPLIVDWNGERFGAAGGYDMSWSFPEHVAHAARTRSLCAGTIIGGGTVSNENYREVGSSCIAERRGIETIDEGKPRTGFMKFSDRVRMEATLPNGAPLFGVIDQQVVQG